MTSDRSDKMNNLIQENKQLKIEKEEVKAMAQELINIIAYLCREKNITLGSNGDKTAHFSQEYMTEDDDNTFYSLDHLSSIKQ